MSDFEDILNAPTQEEMEARVIKWTSKMMKKWQTTGINELEGKQLLQVWGGKQEVPTNWDRQRRRECRFKKNGKLNGLQYAAMVFEKDERTIRRWCEEHHFPGANRTAGGHWRIPVRVVEEVRKLHPGGFGRGARKLFGTEAWKEFKSDLWMIFRKRFMQASAMEAALQDKSQSEFLTAPLPFSGEAIDKLKIVADSDQIEYANLSLLARRLFKEDQGRRIDYTLLAKALGIHPSTLYRRYTALEINAAIKGARITLKKREAAMKEAAMKEAAMKEAAMKEAAMEEAAQCCELTQAEEDAQEIQSSTSQVELEKNTPSPYLHYIDPKEADP